MSSVLDKFRCQPTRSQPGRGPRLREAHETTMGKVPLPGV